MIPEPVIILLPVYNDTDSLQTTLRQIGELGKAVPENLSVIIVDDGSDSFDIKNVNDQNKITVIHLIRNLGHQKAIAIGLSYIKEHHPLAKTIVMDCDGEDKVLDIPLLLKAGETDSSTIFFAARKRRTNGIVFKLFYILYKFSFYLFTGKKISFGNYSLIPYSILNKVVYHSEIWNNYPGAIIKSGIRFKTIAVNRGSRHSGKSKMNYTSLILHGFGAIAVFLETIMARIAIISFLLILLSLAAIVTIFVLRTATNLAIPGWASSIGASMFIVLLISFIISLISIFIYLSTQSQRKFIPALHYKDYILHTETIA